MSLYDQEKFGRLDKTCPHIGCSEKLSEEPLNCWDNHKLQQCSSCAWGWRALVLVRELCTDVMDLYEGTH